MVPVTSRVSPSVVFAGIGVILAGLRGLGVLPAAPVPPAWAAPAAGGLGLLSIALAVWSVQALRTFDGYAPVEVGPFRWSRHPMYLGMLGIVAAAAVLTFEPAVALAVPLLAVALDRLVIAPEERTLEEAFGDAYRAYRERVRRWL